MVNAQTRTTELHCQTGVVRALTDYSCWKFSSGARLRLVRVPLAGVLEVWEACCDVVSIGV
jgi:hypothetical protein